MPTGPATQDITISPNGGITITPPHGGFTVPAGPGPGIVGQPCPAPPKSAPK